MFFGSVVPFDAMTALSSRARNASIFQHIGQFVSLRTAHLSGNRETDRKSITSQIPHLETVTSQSGWGLERA